ncbi:small ribosomal subunit Rsm22 family protein [Dictyobacter formicarum]|uniref:Ribosomal small subunit Rsm22 n=1 Tax=Dictyobacter formicarum TaxID=2778368 RepID=A0ABQ3VSM7_9CHLR|nr:small ribosomal subunit Rsm22 family protein [Dictyobacter formicarum]GHO89282.1 ribosomal small subunit Rsm22 [Dictyobacter formicarum]
MSMLSLPDQLESAIEKALQSVPASKWKSAARALSERYRTQRTGQESSLARGADAALGYAAIIMPAAYAQLSGAMMAVKTRVPDWQPATMLDIGSGPGTALWAATEQWPSLKHLTAWEREPSFIELGRQLTRGSEKAALKQTNWQRATIGGKLPGQIETYDLIVLGHVLNELPETLRQEIITLAWQHCSGVLLIVEPGTSVAFPIIKEMRAYLLSLEAHILAPCAHSMNCPLVDDWCHFPQRLERPSFQRLAKGGSAGWEESKFSYAALARFQADTSIWGRLIHQPHKSKRDVTLTVSSAQGIVELHIPKNEREAFRSATDYDWGDVIESAPKNYNVL